MTSFEEFKANMGDEYMKKVKEIAESKNINGVTKVCSACHQLEFDHKPGPCTRASKSAKPAKDISDITEKVMEDVINAIIENTKLEQESKVEKAEDPKKADYLAEAFNNLANVLKQQKQIPSQVTKVKVPPTWAKESLEDYKVEVKAWENAHPGDDYTKYSELLNELKRNRLRVGVSEYVSTVVIDKTRNNKTVNGIVEALEDKYELTKKEKFENLVNMIKDFKPNKSESGEKIFSNIEKIEAEFETLKLKENLNYFLATLFVKVTYENEVINEMEKRGVQELIEQKDDVNIMEEVKKEFKKMKIEGKRDDTVSKSETGGDNKTYYTPSVGSGRSRYDSWRGSREFKDFKRSNSNNWRTQSGNRWRRAQSKSLPRSRPRSTSHPRGVPPEFRSMKEFQDQVLRELKSLKEKQDKIAKIQDEMVEKVINSKYVEAEFDEEDWSKENVNIYFTENIEEVNELVVDCGAPKTLIGKKHLKEYMKHHSLVDEDVEKVPCKQRFKFGPSQTYISTEKAKIPIVMKVKNGFSMKTVEAFVIQAEVPFLLGLNTMKQWRVLMDMESEEMIFRSLNIDVKMVRNDGGHLTVPLQKVEEWSTVETVMFMKTEDDVCSFAKVKKVHENTNHKSEQNLLHAYKEGNYLTDEVRKVIRKVCENCKVCQKLKKSQSKPKVALPKVTDFNQVVTLDLKQFAGKNVLWAVDSFTRFIQGIEINNKRAETVIDAISEVWSLRFGYPTRGFWADNGSEFQNKEMVELMSKLNLKIEFGPAYSPWSNGMNERNHYSADIVVRKVMEADKKISLKKAVNLAAWTHNTNVNVLGYEPMRLVTGKSSNIPGITVGNEATEAMFDSEAIQKIMERHHEFIKKFREVEYSEKIKKAANTRSGVMNNRFYKEGEEVFYQEKDKNAWLGPVKVFCQRGREVYIFANGNIKKVHTCKVKPFKCEVVINIEDDQEVEKDPRKVTIKPGEKYAENYGVNKEGENGEETSSNSEITEDLDVKEDVEKDTIGTYWMISERNECFNDEIATYVVELPVHQHNKPEVQEAKKVELKNLKDYDTFEEVVDCGQERITSRWVVTVKEAHDGQKTKYKARLVARGFQEETPPQSDSPTVLRESNKLFTAVAANEGFVIVSVDIRAAFLQSKELNRDVFVVPPKDIAEEGVLWKLKKSLYGLNDASRRFWLRVKAVFEKESLKTVPGDEAFYFKNEKGDLEGMIITHVDDFQIAGSEGFIENILNKLKETLTVSKVEKGHYRFTGIDVKKVESGIELSMEDYANSIEEIKEIRKEKKEEPLTKTELKVYRKYTGKLNWLAENTRPDLSIWALNMSKKNTKATIGDLKKVNQLVKKVKIRQSKVKFSKIGRKEDLVIHAVGDASYKSDGPSVGGNLIMLGNKETTSVIPLYWKSKQIKNVCHSAKEAETRNVMKIVDTSVYLEQQLALLLFGDVNHRIPLKIYTDSKPLLDSIASSKQVEQRLLRNTMADLKKKLEEKVVSSYSWIDTKAMTADVLTKEGGDIENILEVVRENTFRRAHSEQNMVVYKDGEMMMKNTVNKNDEFDQNEKFDQTRAGGE